MQKENQPLAEVFGHLPTDFSQEGNTLSGKQTLPFQ